MDDRGNEPGATVSLTDPGFVERGREATAETEVAEPVESRGDEVRATDLQDLTIVDRGHYELLGEIDRGGLGKILRARDRRTGRTVAIKEMLHGTRDAASRFCREAMITANLEHPAVVPVYEVGRWASGEPFYAMRLLARRTLADAITMTTTLRERLGLIPNLITIADAIAYAHHRRIIHRDLKPANVLVGDFGDTVVIDWGLAKQLDRDDPEASSEAAVAPDPERTAAGSVVGTLPYMPPEQALGEPVDERADVYALGAILYHLLTGEAPYREARDRIELVERLLSKPPRPVRDRAHDAPPDLLSIVDKAMARDPGARYPDARLMAEDLRRFQTGQLVGAHRYTLRELVSRWIRRHRAITTVAAIAIVVVIVGATIFLGRERRLRLDAERSVRGLLTEQGRQELVAGHSGRALVFLAEAYAGDPDDPTLRFLVARAMRPFDAEVLALPPDRSVRMAAVSSRGDRIVTASADGARVWDATSGRLALDLAHGAAVRCAGFSSDGKVVVTVEDDRTSRLWDSTGRMLGRIAAIPAGDCPAALLPDGSGLITVDDRVVSIWYEHGARADRLASHLRPIATARVLTGEPTSRASDAEHPIRGAAGVITAGDDGAIGVWNEGHDALAPFWLEGHVGGVLDVVGYQTDAMGIRLVSRGTDGGAALWDGYELRSWLVFEGARHVAIDPTSGLAAVALADGSVGLWSAGDGTRRATLVGHGTVVTAIAFSGDGRRMVTASEDGVANVWDVEAASPIASFESVAHLAERALDPTGRRLVVVGRDGVVRVLDVDRGGRVAAIDVGERVGMLAFGDERRMLCAGGATWDLDASPPITSSGHCAPPLSSSVATFTRGKDFAVAPDGSRIAITDCRETRILDAHTGELAGEIPCGACWSYPLRFAGSGVLAVGCASGSSRDRAWELWSLAPLRRLRPLQGEPIGFDAHGARMVVAGPDATRIEEVSTGAVVSSLPRGVTTAAFSPDGERIIVDSGEVIDVTTGLVLAGFPNAAGPVAFSRDGTRIAITGRDRWSQRRSVEVWEVGLERRAPAEIRRIAHDRVPWRLAGGKLVPIEVRFDRNGSPTDQLRDQLLLRNDAGSNHP